MILIVDFGSQTAHLIGRRLRDLGVQSTYVQPNELLLAIRSTKPNGIIFSGGPASVYERGAPRVDSAIYKQNIPIFAICYGSQLMVRDLGGQVSSGSKEYGQERLSLTQPRRLGLRTNEFDVVMSHGDSVDSIPADFKVIGSTNSVKNAFIFNSSKRFLGALFHPEADHTKFGKEILAWFCDAICGESLSPTKIDIKKIVLNLREEIGDKKVICAVSGGVDSTVAAALLAKAIGNQLIVVYVESGLMREGTKEDVARIFLKDIPAKLVVVRAQTRFLKALEGVIDPERKRKIIGSLYVKLFEEIANQHKGVAFLGQGTIYSDVIESKGSKHASKIKSHHNVGGLPKHMKLKLIEPVRNYYKDEVRWIAKKLFLPSAIVNQHPFPGPGFAIRIRGEVTKDRLKQVKIADSIVMEEVQNAGLYDRVFQAFAVLTGAYSTAVKGDAREFSEVVAVRAYESTDVMTSQWAHFPYAVLEKISSRIVNEVPRISRVVYDITSKPPATMEWE